MSRARRSGYAGGACRVDRAATEHEIHETIRHFFRAEVPECNLGWSVVERIGHPATSISTSRGASDEDAKDDGRCFAGLYCRFHVVSGLQCAMLPRQFIRGLRQLLP